jgi:hypothetical protein
MMQLTPATTIKAAQVIVKDHRERICGFDSGHGGSFPKGFTDHVQAGR